MNTFLKQLIEIKSLDPDDARRRKNLNIMLASLGALLIPVLITSTIAYWNNNKEELILTIGASIFMLAGIVVVYFINRLWSGTIAAALFLIILTIALSFSDTPEQLTNGRSLFIYIIPIAISSLVLPPITGFFFAALGSGIITWIAYSISRLPNVPGIAGFFLVALVSWLSSRSLEQALKDLRAINLNLDKLVEQKTQELATTLSRELILSGRNQAILNSIADGVIVFDEHNTAILANPALSQLTETPIHNLVNKEISDFIQNKSLSSTAQSTLLELLENPRKSATGMRINWDNKTLSTSIARVRDTGNKFIGTVAVFRDVTREVELEKMKDTFMGIVSHELRTPLNAVLGYAEMLKEGVYGPVTEKQQSISTRIMTNTERLLAIVSDLLDQAQIQSGKLKTHMIQCRPAEILEALHGVMDKIALDKGIEFITELDPAIPPVIIGDPQRLQQIMVNLANNAIRFTEKGSVLVKVSRADENNWHIQSIDTGTGIAKEAQEYIFESFRQVEAASTRQHGGVGLGLSIVKQLVELMKGKITVESEIGKGSIFTATLPLIVYQGYQPTITKAQE